MAENQDGTEKSEEPTEKKKSKAREEGQLPRSKELTTFLTLIAAIVGLVFYGARLLEAMQNIFRESYIVERTVIFDTKSVFLTFKEMLSDTVWALFPFLVVLAITGIVASMALGGYNFTSKPLKPKPSKLNPLKGFKKIIGKQGLVELIKSALKISFLGTIAVIALSFFQIPILSLYDYEFKVAFYKVMELIALQFFIVSLGMIVIAAIDVAYQVYTNKEQLKMTKQEVKDENKNSEGNPEVKGRQRQIQRQVAIKRMMSAVPDADVVITNPTHYAVALKYDPEKEGAPVLIAKGVDMIALKIVQIAKGNDVMVVEIPPLSRAIYHSTEVDQEIPTGLYVAVAQVLAYIFQIKNGEIYHKTPFDDSRMDIPNDLKR